MQLLAAQVEKAVAEPRVLGIGLVAENRQREIARRTEHFDLLHINLDQPGWHLGVLGPGGPHAHEAVDAHDEFGAQLFGVPEGRRVGIDHALRQAVMIAQVDEQQAAMVAAAVAPAGKAHGLPDLGEAERAASVGAVSMHGGFVFCRGWATPGA